MTVLEEAPHIGKGKLMQFFCPGCRYYHSFLVGVVGHSWDWNGNMEKPTFSPSMLVNRGTSQQCHLFVREGKIQFLNDCWHELRGKTVEMEDIESI